MKSFERKLFHQNKFCLVVDKLKLHFVISKLDACGA